MPSAGGSPSSVVTSMGASSPGGNPPGMSANAGQQSSINGMSQQAKSQAIEAGRGMQNMQAVDSKGPQRTESALNRQDGHGGYQIERAQNGAPGQQTAQAGSALQGQGVSTGEKQSPETQAQMQSALDNAGKTGGNGAPQETSRYNAARQQAPSSPNSPSPSIEK